jgi:branched-chain amino acid transport system substrate-binding protein
VKALLAAVVILSLLFNRATADPELGVGTPDEIRIGSVMPYTGPLAAFASIGRTEAAYFQMINERGGINGHKLRLISYDDGSDPTRAYIAETRRFPDLAGTVGRTARELVTELGIRARPTS